MTAPQFVDVAMFDTGPTTFTGEIHPYAAAFPMLPDADIDALAADIKANGLLNPILLDEDGMILDGRNRLAACDRAGIQPTFERVYTADPIALIISANMQRRDLTQAQKAHLLVVSLSDSDNRTQEDLSAVSGVPRPKIAEASVVARYTPEASRAVIEGRMTHAAAYDDARAKKRDDDDTRARRVKLEAEAPDLLALDLPEAWAAYLERTRKDRERAEAVAANIRQATASVTEAIFLLNTYGANLKRATDWLANYDPRDAIHPTTQVEVDAAVDALTAIRKGLKK